MGGLPKEPRLCTRNAAGREGALAKEVATGSWSTQERNLTNVIQFP